MTLKECIELGAACGLKTVEECYDNVMLHCNMLFKYETMLEEMKKLDEEFYEYLEDNAKK